ncbi:MAG: SbcC/MukB-like Walker B domain-containing protein [Bacteroidota bacterium]
MKILKIAFKNINNLKGENVISFEEEPLKTAGIFAITGPTGSGKSTLLDVITLALFNKIPRFKGSITKSNIEGLGSVMTHHTDEASASITYEIHDQKYTSSWSLSRTRTGNLKDYEMFIYDANGTPLDLKKSEVPAKNEAFIGLKYDQFVKSIILSQGQFSRFLKADKSERGQLLENLTGASIYRKISIAAYEKFKTVKDEVALEKDRLDHIRILSKEDRAATETQIEADNHLKADLDAKLQNLQAVQQVKSDIQKMTAALASKKGEQEFLKKEIETYRTQLDQLDIYDKLSPILGELTRYKDAKVNQSKLQIEIKASERMIIESEGVRKEVLGEMTELTGVTIEVDNFNKEMSRFEKEIHTLNQELGHVQKKGEEARERINSKAEMYKLELNPKAGPDVVIPLLQKRMEGHDLNISTAGMGPEITPEEVDEVYNAKVEELEALSALQLAYESETLARSRKIKTETSLSELSTIIDRYTPLKSSAEKLVLSTKKNIKLLEKQRQDAMLIAQLSDHRKELTDGEPCPLCGALEHPYSEHVPKEDSELDLQIENASTELTTYEREYEQYHRNVTESKAQKKLLDEQMSALEEELQNAILEIENKRKTYTGSENVDKNKIKHVWEKMKNKVDLLSKVSKSVRSRSMLLVLIEDFNELQAILSNYKELHSRLKSRYTGDDVSAECNALQNRFVEATTKITTQNAVLANYSTQLKQIEGFIEKTLQKLTPEVEGIGFSSLDETAAFIISENELNQLKAKKEEFAQKSVALKTEIGTLLTSIEEGKQKDSMMDTPLENVNQMILAQSAERESLIRSIGEKTAILQKDDQEKERIKSKESELKKLQEKLDKWSLLNKLIGEKTGNKFANFAQGLTLQNLLVYANNRLLKLSDRYLLDKPLKDGPLTVIDQYQGNIQRSVTTLSGGESFLISLALALSLSDMASKNVNLESLFIDEGFGTLDQDSLDIAMNTLERLQTESQKTVGVISHVEALKERIHVQIKMEKNAQGYGRIGIDG